MVQHENLLLVEDDGATRELLTLLLQAEGWSVAAAESGEEAVAHVQQPNPTPAVVLCDLRLPGLCGEALAQALHHALPGACLLAMSATASAQVKGYAAGLLKPFPPAAVQQEWERFLSRPADPLSPDTSFVEPDASSADGAGDLPILDESTFLLLQKQMGAAGAQGLYAFALADTGDRLERMKRALEGGDTDVFHREAHAIKGSCGMIGARRLWLLANDAESETLEPTSRKHLSRMVEETEALRLVLETQFPVQQQMP